MCVGKKIVPMNMHIGLADTRMIEFIGIVLCIVGAWFCYMSSHIVEEEKRGKKIPLPWE